MAFLLKAMGFSDDIPGFPFTPSPNDPGRHLYTSGQLSWTLRSGTHSDDAKVEVTIFTCSLAGTGNSGAGSGGGASGNRELVRQLAQNAMRRAKSLMIPGFLKCHGAVEYRDTVYIATEPCVALRDVLEKTELRRRYGGETSEEYAASVAYGVDTLGGALGALQSNRLVHGNVHCDSIFLSTSTGFWRLFGLELISSVDEVASCSSGCLLESARRAGMLTGYRYPPELGSGNDGVASSVDGWGLACLLYESLGVSAEEAAKGGLSTLTQRLSAADLYNTCRRDLPKSLQSACSQLLAANVHMRKSIATFLASCEFVKDSVFVQYMRTTSEMVLMSISEQVEFAESLAAVIDAFPIRACLCFVLPRLGDLMRTVAKIGSTITSMGVSLGPVAAPVLKVAHRTPAGEEFDLHVTPVLMQLYQSTDVLLRYRLLLGAAEYGGKVSSSALNESIWPLYMKGFAYTAGSVREYSARALVHLAPHLTANIMGMQVPKVLAQLQRDPDGAVRANATVALHLVSGYITPLEQRASVMLTNCRPMLRDAFEPSRVAALRSLHGALDYLSNKQMAEMVIPAVAPLTVDPASGESRAAALSLLKAAVHKLEAHHKDLSAQQPFTATEQAIITTNAGAPPVCSSSSAFAPSSAVAVPAGNSEATAKASGRPTVPEPSSRTTLHHVDPAPFSPSPLGMAASSHLPATAAGRPRLGVVAPAMNGISGGGGGSGWDGWGDDDADGDDGWGDVGIHANANPTDSGAPSSVVKTSSTRPSTLTGVSSSISKTAATISTHGSGVASPLAPAMLPIPKVTSMSVTSSLSSPLGSGGASSGFSSANAATGAIGGSTKLRKKGGLGAARLA